MTKKSTKKLISTFLALVMMLTIIPMGAMSALAEDAFETNILVNDKSVSSEMTSGTGWSYDNASKTITLNGFNGTLGTDWVEGKNLENLTVKLEGTNTVDGGKFGFSLRYISDVTFEGTGSLTIKTDSGTTSDAASHFFGVTFNGGTINVSTDRRIAIAAESSIVFNAGTLNLTATQYPLLTNGIRDGKIVLPADMTISGAKFYKYDIENDYKMVECPQAEALMIEKAGEFKLSKVIAKEEKTETTKTSTVKLGATKYTYDGKVKSPSLTVKNADGKTLVKGTDYTVSVPKGRKAVGKYTYKVTFKGKYSGTKSVSFTIVPKNTSVSKLTAKKAGFKVAIKKYTTQTTGYQIRYSTSSKMSNPKTVTIKNTTTSKSVSKLSKGKKYYVQIRTYKTVNGTKYYSSWSTAKSVKTK